MTKEAEIYHSAFIKLFKIDSNTTEDDVNKWLRKTIESNNIIDIRMQLDNDGYEHILIIYMPKPYSYRRD